MTFTGLSKIQPSSTKACTIYISRIDGKEKQGFVSQLCKKVQFPIYTEKQLRLLILVTNEALKKDEVVVIEVDKDNLEN